MYVLDILISTSIRLGETPRNWSAISESDPAVLSHPLHLSNAENDGKSEIIYCTWILTTDTRNTKIEKLRLATVKENMRKKRKRDVEKDKEMTEVKKNMPRASKPVTEGIVPWVAKSVPEEDELHPSKVSCA